MTTASPTPTELNELRRYLTPPERDELDSLLLSWRPSTEARHGAGYSPHAPTERQRAFLDCAALEAMYGGAAGGGKSDALLMGALEYVDRPQYAALLLRRSYSDLSLPGALMDRANDWLRGSGAHWNEQKKTWRFPGGATVTFGYLESETDKYRYQGSEFQFIGFDELTQFTESQYRYLLSRLRRPADSTTPLRLRSATNPGGVGHEWVKARFVDPGDPGRPFIPAKLEDNPHLDQVEYERSLAELDIVTRQQLRHGDWDVLPEGRMFRRDWFEIVDAAPAIGPTVRFWDMAATEEKPGTDPDWTAGVKMRRSPEGVFYVLDVRRLRGTPKTTEQAVKQTAEEDGRGVAVWMEEEGGSSGKTVTDHYTRRVLPGWNYRGIRSTGPKTERAGPLSSQAEAGNVKLVRGSWNTDFLDEISPFPSPGVHDDQVDAASGALSKLTRTGEKPQSKRGTSGGFV